MIKLPRNKTFTTGQVEYILAQEIKRVIRDTINQYSAALAMCLHDQINLDGEEAGKLFTTTAQVFDSISSGALTLGECFEYLEKHTEMPLGILFGDEYNPLTRKEGD